jgi:transcriptional regulator with XRE-family HTH domain
MKGTVMVTSIFSVGAAAEDAVDSVRGGAGGTECESSMGTAGEDMTDGIEVTGGAIKDLWSDPDLAAALASRDIAQIFRYLQKRGFSQRRIAALTGQSQSEISEILCGRTVTSYPVLERIVVGLGIPRGRLGLAYDDAHPVDSPQTAVLSDHGIPVYAPSHPTPPADRSPLPVGPNVLASDTDAEISAIVRAVLTEMPSQRQGSPLTVVGLWTGLHIRALRESMRMSVRAFAEYLGVSDRMVSKWEAGGAGIRPQPLNQAALDTCLDRLDDDMRQRFTEHVAVVLAAEACASTRSRTAP